MPRVSKAKTRRHRQPLDLKTFINMFNPGPSICRPHTVIACDRSQQLSPDTGHQQDYQVTPETPEPVPFLFPRTGTAGHLSEAEQREIESPVTLTKSALSHRTGQRISPLSTARNWTTGSSASTPAVSQFAASPLPDQVSRQPVTAFSTPIPGTSATNTTPISRMSATALTTNSASSTASAEYELHELPGHLRYINRPTHTAAGHSRKRSSDAIDFMRK